jgi:hypothetical protein
LECGQCHFRHDVGTVQRFALQGLARDNKGIFDLI